MATVLQLSDELIDFDIFYDLHYVVHLALVLHHGRVVTLFDWTIFYGCFNLIFQLFDDADSQIIVHVYSNEARTLSLGVLN